MKYFKNTELAKLYNVSEKSVRNWIQAAQEEKINLQLYEKDGKFWVANTSKNIYLIEEQVQKGKKYKNSRGFKVISPTSDFYENYSQKQILDIISNLIVHREVPTQYSYVDGGAKYWDQYANRLYAEETPNILNMTIQLLQTSFESIERLIDTGRQVNIVDLGPGNGLPIRKVIERLLEQGRLKKYIAIDGSKEMLQILEENIHNWFGGQVQFEGHVRDLTYERFDDLFADDYATDDANIPVNLVFLLGGTLSNFRFPNRTLQTVNSSLGLNDLLIYTGYLDTPHTRRYFDFNTSQPNQKLRSELILGFLGIDDSLYDIEQVFDEKRYGRFGSFVPKVDLSIKFELANGVRYVEIPKNESVLLWRHWHKDAIDIINQFDENDFDPMLVAKSKSNEYLLLVAKIKTNL